MRTGFEEKWEKKDSIEHRAMSNQVRHAGGGAATLQSVLTTLP
jgi:hypothetical protein